MDADGAIVVTWEGIGGYYDHNIYARRYDRSGAAQGDEFRVNACEIDPQQKPAVAMDADGNFVIAWDSTGIFYPPSPSPVCYQQDPPLADDYYGIAASRFTAGGAPLPLVTFLPFDLFAPFLRR